MNTLYCGDCLDILRQFVPDESVDLVYIDPPFNSKRDYNIFFDEKKLQTQRIAFEDTWTYKNVQESIEELHTLEHEELWALLLVYQKVAPKAFPYLVMMALRLLELHRVLKKTGSFYLHCDPTMSHYLKTMCDTIFDEDQFRDEIVWKRSPFSGSSKARAQQLPHNHDLILFYTRGSDWTWNPPTLPYTDAYLDRFKWKDDLGSYRKTLLKTYSKETLERLREEGRLIEPTRPGAKYSYKQYLHESKGFRQIDDVWVDINMLNPVAKERLGYPTQKPKALLERIIRASSNEDDIVLDAFCGCGTTVDAAESLRRKWIGIDISPVAITLIKRRLRDAYKSQISDYEVKGIPVDEASAIKLWQENQYAFQDWWLLEFEVFSQGKGADKGIDGIGLYKVGTRATDTLKVAFQVKGGEHISSKDVDALLGILTKFDCKSGVFLTIEPPTKPMLETIATSGTVKTPMGMYPKLQLLTLKGFFEGKKLKLPKENITFKKAATHKARSEQLNLDEQ